MNTNKLNFFCEDRFQKLFLACMFLGTLSFSSSVYGQCACADEMQQDPQSFTKMIVEDDVNALDKTLT